MGVDTCVSSICYVLINRNQIHQKLKSSLEVNQSFHGWLRDWVENNNLGLKVVKGVSDGRFIFDEDFAYLRERLGYSSNIEEEISEDETQERKKLDFEWAAVILTEIDFDLEADGPHHRSFFNPNELRVLFANPDQDLQVRNEVWVWHISISYITIHREQINKNLEPGLKPDQPLSEWVQLHFPEMCVIKGVNNERAFCEQEHGYLIERLGYNVPKEDQPDEDEIQFREELDFEWAAIIVAETIIASKRSPQYDSFNPLSLKKLFANPKKDLIVHSEAWLSPE